MKTKFQFQTDEEKKNLISQYPTLTIIEEQYITDGNFIIFSDNPQQDIETVFTQVPQDEFNKIQSQLKTADEKYKELDLSTIDLPTLQTAKMAQLNYLYQQTLKNGFVTTIGGSNYTFAWTTDDKANILLTQQGIGDAFITFPIDYADINGNSVTLNSQSDLDLIKSKAASFFNAQHQQILTLIGQVKTATTTDTVNSIQWAAAVY